MKALLARSSFIASLLVLTGLQPATAATFSINPYGVSLAGGAVLATGSFGNSGIILPEDAQSSFAFGFVIPEDYRRNTPIRIVLSYHSSATGCDFSLRPNFVDRTRPGHPPSTGSASGGLVASNGSNLLPAASTANQGSRKVYRLSADQGFADQRRGDAIVLGFFRRPTDADDTCADRLLIPSIDIVYRTR